MKAKFYFLLISLVIYSITTFGQVGLGKTCADAHELVPGICGEQVHLETGSINAAGYGNFEGITPSCWTTGSGNVVWYKFKALETSHYVDSECYSGLSTDVMMVAYAGTCQSLSEIACSDDGTVAVCPASGLTLTGLTIDSTYYIALESGDSITPAICVEGTNPPAPINDNCANSISMEAEVLYHTNNVNATIDKDLCSGSIEGNIWYHWSTPCNWTTGDTVFLSIVNQNCAGSSGMQLSIFQSETCSDIPDPAAIGDCILYSNTQTDADQIFEFVPIPCKTYFFNLDGYAGVECIFDLFINTNKCKILLVEQINNTTCGNNDGSASVSVTNSTSPLYFYWSDGTSDTGITSAHQSFAIGTYSLSIIDVNGCKFIKDIEIPGPVTSSFEIDSTFCDTTMNHIYFINTGTDSGSCGANCPIYLWDFGDGSTSSMEDPNHKYINTGTDTVRLITIDGACSDTISKSIQLDTCGCVLKIDAGADTTICVNSSLVLNGSFNYSQCSDTTVSVNASEGGIFDYCSGTFYDPEGPGANYATDIYGGGGSADAFRIGNGTSGQIKICFSDIDINPSTCGMGFVDKIELIDGSFTAIEFTITNAENGTTPCYTISSSDGYAYIRFIVYCTPSSYEGWAANFSTVDGSDNCVCPGGCAGGLACPIVTWTPSTYLNRSDTSQVVFTAPGSSGVIQQILTVTDDNCTVSDIVSVNVVSCDTSCVVASYPFNGNANDESGNGNNGTVNGATLTIDRFGSDSSAYSFDGVDDYIISSSTVSVGLERTVNFWAKVPTTNVNPSYTPILVGSDFAVSLGNWGGTGGALAVQDGAANWYGADSLVDDGEWHFYSVTASLGDTSGIEFYQDGKILKSRISDNNFTFNSSNYIIEIAKNSNGGIYLNGSLDEIKIYNCTLDSSQIDSIYQAEKPPDPILPLSVSLTDSANANCYGSSDGYISLTVSGGVSPYTYTWSDGQSGSIANGLSAGTYIVTITDYSSTQVYSGFTITEPAPLNIQFDTSSTSGLTVNFTNNSTGSITNWFWDFGDGTGSTSMNPSHTYLEDGYYNICLSGNDSVNNCSNSLCKIYLIGDTSAVVDNCFASFEFDSTGNNQITFADSSIGDYTDVFWNFGDSYYSDATNPVHTYLVSGFYSTCLTVYDSLTSCQNTICQNVEAKSSQKSTVSCLADFDFFPDATNNLLVYFTNTSQGAFSDFYWDFGDGFTSFEKNPEHTYSQNNSYNVCLTSFDSTSGCSDHYCEDLLVYDSTLTFCNASFTFYPDSFGSIYFNNTSTGSITDHYWTFGNGSVSTDASPILYYTSSGIIDICLTVFDSVSQCIDEYCDVVELGQDSAVVSDCYSDFSYYPTNTGDVYFTNLSVGGQNAFWEFGDGSFSSSNDSVVTHSYSANGYFDVCLTIYDTSISCIQTHCKNIQVGGDSALTSDCQAVFSYFPLPNNNVKFQNEEKGQTTDYQWTFGDGQVSTNPNPVHDYGDPGFYETCLTIFNATDSCMSTYCEMIQVGNEDTTVVTCQADFVYFVDSATNTVSLQDQSSGDPDYWYWNLDNNSVANTQQNPTITYSTGGFYEVCLTIYKGSDCQSTICKVISVGDISNSVYADFAYYADSITSTAYFENQSLGSITTFDWDFGDTQFSIFENPTHTYADTGRYLVCFTVFNGNGISDFVCKYITIGNSLSNKCRFSCIWPGDANNSLESNHYDLLTIAVNIDEQGPARDSVSTRWIGQFSDDWSTLQPDGTNDKYSDCNGDGIIDTNDINIIIQNFAYSHPYNPGKRKKNQSNPDLYFEILSGDVAPGTTVEIAIMLGRDTLSINGIGYELNVGQDIITNGSMSVAYDKCWVGNQNSNLLSVELPDYNLGVLYNAIARNDHQDVDGQGDVANVKFQIDSNTTVTEVIICITSDYGMYASGDTLTVNDGFCDTIKLCVDPVSNFYFTDLGLTVSFIDSSSGADTYLWEFGDGDQNTSFEPSHAYLDSGTYTVCLTTTNSCGSHKLCKDIYISGTSGLSDQLITSKIKMYPNPADQNVSFDVPKSILGSRYEFVNNIGQVVLKGNLTLKSIDVSTLQQGLYHVKIYSNVGFYDKQLEILR
ncbi:MAG: hypothetical protein COC01_00025 [Bacteroidetes bacterium]|nr:MAG: hypothetical protein COC01_00025 [Bacteroidota bacterium]